MVLEESLNPTGGSALIPVRTILLLYTLVVWIYPLIFCPIWQRGSASGSAGSVTKPIIHDCATATTHDRKPEMC